MGKEEYSYNEIVNSQKDNNGDYGIKRYEIFHIFEILEVEVKIFNENELMYINEGMLD